MLTIGKEKPMKKTLHTMLTITLAAAILPAQAKTEYVELEDGTLISYDTEAMDGGIYLDPDVRIKDRYPRWVMYWWYEDGCRQGIYGDPKNITDVTYGYERGREIYDPGSDAWYWLDACHEGKRAADKEVWMPYVYQNEPNGSTDGKWVRYDANGAMIKGWYTVKGSDIDLYPEQAGNTYYYDLVTGEMVKGNVKIDGKTYRFSETSGRLLEDEIVSFHYDVPLRIQENGHYCGPACMQMVLAYHGINADQATLARELNTSFVTGTEYADVARVANSYLFPNGGGAYRSVIWLTDSTDSSLRETFESRVRQDMKTGDPVFAAISLHTIYPDLPTANHLVLIIGCRVNTVNDRIVSYEILDPYSGAQPYTDHGHKSVTADTMWKAMNSNSEPGYIW